MPVITTMNRDNKNVKIESLHEAPHHHRVRWGNMASLRESIETEGLLHALLVRERPRRLGGYEIIDGVRRKRAAADAGLKSIPVVVVDVDDVTAIEMQLRANLEREDVHPMDEALYFKELTDRGMEPAAIAKRYNRKKADVIKRLALCGLSERGRKMFVDGKLDEPASLAIATVDVPARQHDILAALAAGSLQVEDIPGYVARELQASLEDVPWRITDEKLDPKAGACSACPKRTSVQRDLFAEGKGDRCRDVPCYRRKMDATFAAAAKRPGVTVHDAATAELFIPTSGGRPQVIRATGLIDAETACPHMDGLSWLHAVVAAQDPENPPTLYIAQDQDHRPRYLFPEAIVTRLVRRSDAAAAQVAAREAADPTKSDEATAAKREAKIRRYVIAQLAERVAAGDHDVWPWIATRLLEGAAARSVAQTAAQFAEVSKEEAPGLEGKPALVALIGRSTRWAKRVAVSVMIREEADFVGEVPAALRELAKLCEIDIDAIERSVRGGPAAEDEAAA